MGRPRRDITAGIFHVYTHCVWAAQEHFRDDADRMTFVRELARVTTAFEWTCIGYCLMRSHYHLLVQVDSGVLPRAMQSLNWRYAMMFNSRHSMRGHTQFNRYGARRITDGDDLLSRYRYVMRNPVKAGLCTDPADWRWSSYAGTIGLVPAQPFVDEQLVLACLHDEPVFAAETLRRFVALS
jgi:putative transposase